MVVGPRDVWSCWKGVSQCWQEHLEVGLWVVVGLHGSVWGATVIARVPWDADAETEICLLGFNWETPDDTEEARRDWA